MPSGDATQIVGLLNINKPAGVTSRRVVDRVQRLVRPAKAGHAGTLDPLATGVVVVCVGSATRLIEYVQRMRKSYRATFMLGRTSDTEDIEGQVVELADPPEPTEQAIRDTLKGFVGDSMQRPPAFSALKVQGKRAYDLARAGKEVELAARPITVYGAAVVNYAYPRLVVGIECSRGTYVRSLGRDLAESLGTGAVMSALVRTAVGGFRIEDAIALDDLDANSVAQHLLRARTAVADLPAIELTPDEVEHVRHGRTFAASAIDADGELALLDSSGALIAIARPAGDGQLKPVRVFL
ncbi:MAG: tRNA pseudouridine(55) synthase TruB [Pirellulales bacterium]|nr:tRNA pseudouridine(55) synthase TruB [Pirellulales bacterium]